MANNSDHRPLSILHTNFHRGWGGQSNRILAECAGLAALGHRVALAVPEGSELAKRAAAAGLEVFTRARFSRGFRPWILFPDASRLRAYITRERFDIVHTHGSQDSWATALALAGLSPRPIVLRTRHNIFPMRDHVANRWLYGSATDGIVCISEAILEECAAKPYLRRENLSLVHSAVDVSRFGGVTAAQDRADVRAELGLGERYVAGITGRLRAEKGHIYLFDALPGIVKAAPDFTLLVVGAGSLEGEFKERVKSLGVEGSVVFTGFRTDVPRILNALDLFIMPSISEGLGTAIIEAGAASLPIIATRVGGIPDIVKDGETGLLVPPADPSALAQAAIKLHNDPPLARRCAEAARRHVEATFSERSLVEKTDVVYRDWMARRNAAKTSG